ncbi:protein gvpG [Natronomonas salina]|uniref:gas vesicle protein GvpG n=1 Tax=Natronomonas salina TaxID=1710540 RepID=UPI0015B55C9F|nr:protein gvpG [Natronomonas salina]QLD90573.1 protein gvpG [Natronomonas salina]
MTIIVDDLLVRPFFQVLESLQAIAMNELYDIEDIRDRMKENQLLYEMGERDEEEYQQRRRELEAELEVAEQAHEQLSDKSIEVRG